MLDRFVCQARQAEMLHFAPACQYMPVFDIRMAEVKSRGLDDFQCRQLGIPHAACFAKAGDRRPQHS